MFDFGCFEDEKKNYRETDYYVIFIFLCILAVLCRAQRGEPARRCLHQWAPVAVCGEATHRGALRAGRASQRDLAPAARESRLHQQNIGQVN